MKSKFVDARLLGIGCILLSNALSSAAVTLGRHSGAAIIGRPLDIRVQATLAPGEDLASQCIGADVFFGDAQVPAGSVRSTPSSNGTGADAHIRVQSTQPINEPIVMVDVRTGCSSPFTRRYVLLADPLMEPLVPPRVALPPAVVDSAASTPSSSPDTRESNAAPLVQPPRSVVRRTDVPEPPAVARRVAPPATARQATPAARARSSRLQLDDLALELQVERDPALKLSMDLLSEPASGEARAAAGLMWQGLRASPEERWRDVQRLAALEAETQTLRGQDAQAKATIADLNGRLADAESGRYLNGVSYALGLGLLLALAALAVLWRRQASDRGNEPGMAWWAADDAPLSSKQKHDDGTALAPLDLDLTLGADSHFGDFPPLAGVNDALDSLPPSDTPLFALSGKDRRDFAPSLTGAARSVATEELFDVQQQAEFFMSLGDDDQAIKILRSHLADSPEPSALAYLDLLMLYHRLGRREEYDQARAEFNQMFNAGAPPFDQYSEESRSLEDYEAAFGRIQALWPDPRVLDVIEESIFREPGRADAEVFDLEAYRELLLLHAMAKDMIKREVAPSRPMLDFQHTNVEPLKAAGKKGGGRTSVAAAAVAAAGAVDAVSAEGAGRAVAPATAVVPAEVADALPSVSPLPTLDAAPAERGAEAVADASPAKPPVTLDVDLGDLATFSMFEALVLLHTMAKDMIKPEEGTSESRSDVQPLSVGDGDAGAVLMGEAPLVDDPVALDLDAHASHLAASSADERGLDLDLSESSDFSLFEASLPELPAPEPIAQTPKVQEEGAKPVSNLIEFEMPDFLMHDDPWSSERGRRTPGA